MTPLVWANFPLMFLFALAIVGIPMWMIFKRPDRAPDHSQAHHYLRAKAEQEQCAEVGAAAPAQVAVMATAAAPAAPRRGRWQLTAPRGRVPARRRPAAARGSRPRARDAAGGRGRGEA